METLEHYIKEQMKDAAFRKAYAEQKPEMERIRAEIKKRKKVESTKK